MLTRVRPFRHAASIILASNFPHPSPASPSDRSNSDNLAILTVKRKTSSSFMPSTVVFPGGAIDDADFDNDFSLAYKQIFLSQRKLSGESSTDDDWIKHIRNIESNGQPKPPAYSALRESTLSSKMLPEWALRICALRELFEECGILIGFCLNEGRYVAMDAKKNVSTDKSTWNSCRKRVHDSADQFHKVSVQELAIVPAFWLLDEWSNWLAPSVYKQRSRFDTLFYLLCLDEMPTSIVNEDELERGEWANPRRVIAEGANGKIVLAPPQIYEMSRLANFSSVEQLRSFSEKRRSEGLIRFFPQLANTADGKHLCLLPGDDQYPASMDETASEQPLPKFDDTAAQIRSKYKNLHRAELNVVEGHYLNGKLFVTIPPPCGHVTPVST